MCLCVLFFMTRHTLTCYWCFRAMKTGCCINLARLLTREMKTKSVIMKLPFELGGWEILTAKCHLINYMSLSRRPEFSIISSHHFLKWIKLHSQTVLFQSLSVVSIVGYWLALDSYHSKAVHMNNSVYTICDWLAVRNLHSKHTNRWHEWKGILEKRHKAKEETVREVCRTAVW